MTGFAPDYHKLTRSEAADMLPSGLGRVLEVGCGAGATLAYLKKERDARWTAGIEVVPEAATEASRVADKVWTGDIEHFDLPVEPASLDAILCLDVLEHLVDPWKTIKRLVAFLRPGGMLVASLPNIRNYKVVLPLLLRGEFRYDPAGGILDATHLRFFVRGTAIELLTGAGLAVERVEILGLKRGKLKWLINKLLFGALTDLYARQYLIVGRKP